MLTNIKNGKQQTVLQVCKNSTILKYLSSIVKNKKIDIEKDNSFIEEFISNYNICVLEDGHESSD